MTGGADIVDPTEADDLAEFEPTRDLGRGSTLLEASAGTGKTYTIANLVLRLVAEYGVELPEILVVTFTRAATSELRDRVRRRLNLGAELIERRLAGGELTEDQARDPVLRHLVEVSSPGGDDELERRLRRLTAARERFDDATISTIHGFCQETLHQSAFESDVDLDAELVENLDDLLEEIVHDLIVAELRGADPDWYAHLRAHGVGREDLLVLSRRLEAEPHLRVVPEDPLDDPEDVWTATVADFRRTWEQHRDEAVAWLEREAAEGGRLHRKNTYREQLGDIIAAVDGWVDGVAAAYRDVCKQVGMFTREELERRTGDAYLASPVFDAFSRLDEVGGRPATAFKVRFAGLLLGELGRRKRARNILSFNDLLRGLRDGLAREETRAALRGVLRDRFAVALIDEFQDTDPVQWAIFETVFAEHGSLYLIGDPKQAIYAFRGADVHTYLEAAKGIDDRATLRTNWRSDRDYVEALNVLFREAPVRKEAQEEDQPAAGAAPQGADDRVLGHPDIPYIGVRAAPPNQHRRLTFEDGEQPPFRIVHVTRERAGVAGTSAINKDWYGRQLPRLVADEIVHLLTSGARIDPGGGEEVRDVLPRDVAVLTRTNDQAAEVQAALGDRQVHAVASGGGSVFESAEAVVLQRLLGGVLASHIDREAKAAVTSPILGVRGHELAGMSERDWEGWLESLAGWSEVWRDRGVTEMIRRIFDGTGSRERLLSLSGGERRLTNVLHLLELLHQAERAERLGPSGLVAWLRERRQDPPKDRESTEIRLESDEDAVKVLTVHRAKGLEYPVVWCPWLWEKNGLHRDEPRNLRLHDHAEDGRLSIDVGADTQAPRKLRNKEIAQRERWQENLRLMYVALTRARHRCTVHWGPFRGAGNSPLGRLFHGWDLEDPTNTKLTDEQMRERLQEIAAASGGLVEVVDADRVGSAVYRAPERVAGELVSGTFARVLDRRWQRTSFSRLTREERDAAPAPRDRRRDVDAGTEPDAHGAARAAAESGAAGPADPQRDPSGDVPLAHLPRGAAAGTFLHDVLERVDFTQADDERALREVVDAQLERHRLDVPPDVPLVGGLRAALRTPLGPRLDDACLADIPMSERLNELDFDLPIAGGYAAGAGGAELSIDGLTEVLGRHAGGMPILERYIPHLEALETPPARGFLTGSIDLVFRVPVGGRSRYVVADHKSNWLGERGLGAGPDRSVVGDYHPDQLAGSMVEHHYVLQALLYLVGLHRLLRWRLGEDYDYDADVGGVLYLFLRGMVGPDTPTADDGTPHGVFPLTPPRELIGDLDQLLTSGQLTAPGRSPR